MQVHAMDKFLKRVHPPPHEQTSESAAPERKTLNAEPMLPIVRVARFSVAELFAKSKKPYTLAESLLLACKQVFCEICG